MNVCETAEQVLAGIPVAIARAITTVERGGQPAEQLMAELLPRSGTAHVVGVTGSPGSGKSTLVSGLVKALRRRQRSVGVIAVDPSSPYTGGAILGDRIRMGALGGDPAVFIRSMATHGALGGLARPTADAITVLDSAGKDVVVIETVGVGQDEIDIAGTAHTIVVVSIPGTGDEIQTLKAGVLEIADVHVVNKADRPGADRLAAQLIDLLQVAGLRDGVGAWHVPVRLTIAEDGSGIDTLCDVLLRHRVWLEESGSLPGRERAIVEARVRGIVQQLVREHLDARTGADALQRAVDEVALRNVPPIAAARTLVDGLIDADLLVDTGRRRR